MLGHALSLSQQAFAQALDPAAAIAARRDSGCAASEPLNAMLVESRVALDGYATWRLRANERVALAEEGLVFQARELCEGGGV